MEDFYEDFNPFYESNDYLMSDPEEDEPAPEPEAPEEGPSEPEPEAPEEGPSEPEPEAPEEGPSEPEPEPPPAVEEIPGGLPVDPEVPEESGDSSSGFIQDIIDAIDELGETITGTTVTEEPEELEPPATEQEGAEDTLPVWFLEYEASSGTDLTPVVELLEASNESLVQVNNNLLQLQANVVFVFLAGAALIGVVLGVSVGKLFHDLWRA